MKFHLSILTLLSLTARAVTVAWLPYDTNRCVPYQTDASICRTAWDWFVTSTNAPSCYFKNGVQQGCESGTWSLRLPECWKIATGKDVKVTVLDLDTIHGLRVRELCRKVCDSQVTLRNVVRYYPDAVSLGISNAVAGGAQVVVMPFGVVGGSSSDPRVLSALRFGDIRNVVFVAAAPYDGRNLDVKPDWPNLPYLIQVTHGRMDGTINSGYTATGTNTLCFPGRNLVAQGVYYGGNSDASGVAGGCVALLIDQKPRRSNRMHVTKLRQTSEEVWHRVNLLAALK